MKVQVGGGFVAVAPAITADGEALRRRATLRPRSRALVVLHEGEDLGGRLVQSVSRLRSAPVIARAESGEALPDPATFRLAVLVGSASSPKRLPAVSSRPRWTGSSRPMRRARPSSGSATGPARWRTPSAAPRTGAAASPRLDARRNDGSPPDRCWTVARLAARRDHAAERRRGSGREPARPAGVPDRAPRRRPVPSRGNAERDPAVGAQIRRRLPERGP